MESQDSIRDARVQKLQVLEQKNINAYPATSKRDTVCRDAQEKFKEIGEEKEITLAGRVKLFRLHGGSSFATIDDGTGVFQLFFSKKDVGDSFKNLKQVDLGDFIEATGKLFVTKRGQESLFVSSFTMLSKALLPLPEKFHGLKDVDERFRHRELDLISNEKSKERFMLRSKVIREMRNFLEDENFIEVETPILQVIPGGASAKPFMTHHNTLDIDMYLRIAPELYLKRLIVGGFEKVYEIGRQFRNEGMSPQHNPEFTSCEFYWAYQDYEKLMEFTEQMITEILKKTVGKLTISYQGKELDFTAPYPRYRFHEIIEEKTGVNILELKDEKKLRKAIEAKGFKTDPHAGYAKMIDDFYKDAVRPNLIQPAFIIDHPIELEPLAKKHRDNPELVERFQLLVHGFEILKAYSELNDPIDQLERFKQQEELKERGDDEAQSIDSDFIKALEHGMPPTAGWGMGVDRFVALLADAPSLREVILFPTMKPKSEGEALEDEQGE